MTARTLILQATLLAVVGGTTIIHHPLFIQQPLHSLRPVLPVRTIPGGAWRQIEAQASDYQLPCPFGGFFVHPQNCTRFYRCVDYAGTGNLFSRYFFECPTNHVFLVAAQTCIPGVCSGLVQEAATPPPPQPDLPQQPSPESPAPESAPAPVPSPVPSPVPVTEIDEPVTEPIFPQDPEVVDSPPEEPVTDPIFPSAPEVVNSPPVEFPPAPPPPPTEPEEETDSCPDTYLQHSVYCNVYNPCKHPFVRYVCPTGTVFDQQRQMCRISAQDDGLCTGKEIFHHPFLLRAENIGAHVRLPDTFLLPTAVSPSVGTTRPLNRPPQPVRTASPLQLYLWPTPRPVQTNSAPQQPSYVPVNPSFNSAISSQFRPRLDRPAQDYRQAVNLSPNVYSTFDLPETKTKPVANVRRPEGHLHFPPYKYVQLFGPHQGVISTY